MQAKLDYLAATPDVRGLHEKALLEADGLRPADARREHAGRAWLPAGDGRRDHPVPVAAGPAATLGLRTFDLAVAPSSDDEHARH